MKVGDLISRTSHYHGNRVEKRIGFIRGTCTSVGLPDERTIDVVWLGGGESEWISEFWLKNVEIISEAR